MVESLVWELKGKVDMKTDIVAFYPYSYNSNAYHGMIQKMLSKRYCVVDYQDVKREIIPLENLDVIYLNWIEDVMDESDRKLFLKAKEYGIRIIWVFHNRVSHDASREKKCRDNICFILKHAYRIVILSHESVKYLLEYDSNLEKKKIHYLPHPNYLTAYGELPDAEVKSRVPKDKFVYGCIGTLRSDKNLELIIEAFIRMPDNEKSILLIVGEPSSEDYYKTLQECSKDNTNIYFVPSRIPDYMLNFYVQFMDVLVLPYDLKTCMNSGVMLLAFTNKRTVICSDISMSYEFNENMLYRYSYDKKEQHLEQLLLQMETAYREGKERVKEKGALLYREAEENNSREKVENMLYAIVGEANTEEILVNNKVIIKEYEERYKCQMKYAILEKLLKWELTGSDFLNKLRENQTNRIAIYGYGYFGKLLYLLLRKHEIPIFCVFDRNASHIQTDVPVYSLENFKRSVDIVIVAVMEIDIEQLKRKFLDLNSKCYVIGIEDI